MQILFAQTHQFRCESIRVYFDKKNMKKVQSLRLINGLLKLTKIMTSFRLQLYFFCHFFWLHCKSWKREFSNEKNSFSRVITILFPIFFNHSIRSYQRQFEARSTHNSAYHGSCTNTDWITLKHIRGIQNDVSKIMYILDVF